MSLDAAPEPELASTLRRARALIDASAVAPSRRERATRRSLRRLLDEPEAVAVTIELTDEVLRFPDARDAAGALRRAVSRATPRGFGLGNALALRVAGLASRIAPRLVTRLVTRRVQGLTSNLILDAGEGLGDRLAAHRDEGLRLNVNLLGEAVLGDHEAGERLSKVLALMRRDDVNYVSVKISSVVAQLVTIDHEGSLNRVRETLRVLYAEALHRGVFVNLDMEEYRDLRLTLDAFTSVLDEPAFRDLSAGVVLQAYLPDSHQALASLTHFATVRRRHGGAPIKVRLVKGANLSMEHVEAELHGWRAAPYETKADVDASYCRLLDAALRPEFADALRVGVASHNLFHVAWALELAATRGVSEQIDVEMLEGMANPEALALVTQGERVLLYAPVVARADFASAVSYLVRRLDENTAPENYLRAALEIADRDDVFDEQRRRFETSVSARHELSDERRRRRLVIHGDSFHNEPDGDPTDHDYALSVRAALDALYAEQPASLDTIGHLANELDEEVGVDPNDEGRPWYRYRVATLDAVERAVERAGESAVTWGARSAPERAAVLRDAAAVMSSRRSRTIALMTRDAGKTIAEADPEVSEGVDFARYYAATAPSDGESSPLGVVVVVPPWNFPYAIPAGGVIAALAAGNAVILKPAPETVAVAVELAEQLWAGGVPRGVLQVVPTRDDDVGRRLVTHERVDAVILTGSIDTARLFTSWRPDLRLLAETSGKNALVITASADVDLAVKDLVQSAFGHAGQKCSAASLAIVVRALYEESTFLEQLRDAVTSVCVGPGGAFASQVGPVIHPPDEVLSRALTTLDDGETWLVEPRRLDDSGHLWRPGVKLGVQPGSWSHEHEWFGPVLGVMVADDLVDAVRLQNATAFGLTAGVHALSEEECAAWLELVEAGNLYVNRGVTGAVVRRQPFGGWKSSSVGPTAKAGGAHYVDALRHWPTLHDRARAVELARGWWDATGGRAIDVSGLESERNVARYRRPRRPIVVRVDEYVSAEELHYVGDLVRLANLHVEYSSASVVRGQLDVTLESVDDLVARARHVTKARWLSREEAPTVALLERGRSVDPRPLAQDGGVELARWLLEQSVAITNHRYGNLHAGPKPACPGLSDYA